MRIARAAHLLIHDFFDEKLLLSAATLWTMAENERGNMVFSALFIVLSWDDGNTADVQELRGCPSEYCCVSKKLRAMFESFGKIVAVAAWQLELEKSKSERERNDRNGTIQNDSPERDARLEMH